MGEDKSHEKKYQDYYDRIEEAVIYGKDVIDNRLFAISSGGLTFSFTVFTYLLSKGFPLNKWCVGIIWVVFCVCMLYNIATHIWSVCINRKVLNEVSNRIRNPDVTEFDPDGINVLVRKHNKPLIIGNLIETVLIAINVIFMMVYTLFVFIS